VAGVESQIGRTTQLFRSGRGPDDPRAEPASELQGEAGDASGALDEDSVARLDPGGGHDGVPGCDPGAGQGGCLFEAEVIGNRHHAVLVEENLLGECAVDVATEGAFEFFRGGIAVQPMLEKGARDPIADRDSRYSRANSGDDSRAIRTGNAVGLEFWIVGALDRSRSR